MKNSLLLVVVFGLSFLGLTLFGSLVFVSYINTCSIVVGVEPELKFADVFFYVLIFIIPFVVTCGCLFMVFYIIRHPNQPWTTYVTYFLICLLVWLVIIPCIGKLGHNVKKENTVKPLSSGYFRYEDNGLYYYTDNSTLYINSDKSFLRGSANLDNRKLLGAVKIRVNDPIIADSLKVHPFVCDVADTILMYGITARKFALSGYVKYLVFFTMGVALISLVLLAKVSAWPLLNVGLVLLNFGLIVFVNIRLVFTGALDHIQYFLKSKNFPLSENVLFFPIVINITFILLMILVCVIGAVVNKSHRSVK